MVDTKIQTGPAGEKSANPRDAIREARQRRLRLVSTAPATVKVYAANETLREVLRHPSGTRFRDEIGEAVEWPNDTFTKRRIKEGAVLTDGPGSGEMAEPDESLNVREHAAARKPKPKEEPKNGSKSAPRPSSPQPPAA